MQRDLGENESLSIQAYLDHVDRDEHFLGQLHDTFDFDMQHSFALNDQHELMWGLGYRHVSDSFQNSSLVSFTPSSKNEDYFSAFVQDEITLVPDRTKLIIGSKFELNPYTGLEIQPNVRVLWTPSEQQTYWASVSRALRTPSRMHREGSITVPAGPFSFDVVGSDNVESEELIAYELGYRSQVSESYSIDATIFYNDYDKIVKAVTDPTNPSIPPNPANKVYANSEDGYSYGLEVASTWNVQENWRIKSSYSYALVRIRNESGEADNYLNGSTPQNQLGVHSLYDINSNIEFDIWAKYTDEIPVANNSTSASIDDYLSLNARVAWQFSPTAEVSLTARNLLDPQHMEAYGASTTPATEVSRSIYAAVKMEW